MKEKILKLKDYNLSFILLNIYVFVMLFLPKKYSSICNIPIRLIITFILLGVFFIDYKRKKYKLNKTNHLLVLIIFLLFLISTIPSLFITKNLITSIYTILKYAAGFSLFFVVLKIDFSKKEYSIFYKNVLFCSAILFVIGILFYHFNINLMIKGSGINYYPGAKGRLNTTFFNTIYYGVYLDLILPFFLYLLYKTQNFKRIVIYLVFLGLLYSNLLFTFTRSATIVFFLTFAIMLVLMNKRLLKIRTIFVIIIIIVETLLIGGAKPLIEKSAKDLYTMAHKYTNVLGFLPSLKDNDNDEYLDYDKSSDFVDYSLQHRASFAKMANKIAKDHMYTGVGFGAYIDYMKSDVFEKKYPTYKLPKTHPHSSFTLVYAETGIFGLITFCLFAMSLILMSTGLLIRNLGKNEKAYLMSLVAFCTIIGFMLINFITENAIYDTQVGYIFYLIYGIILSNAYMLEDKRVMFISSTGGHLNELLQLKSLFNKYDSYIVTESTKSTVGLKNKYNNVKYLVYGTKDYKFKYFFKFTFNCIKSIVLYLRIKPKVIVTTGTHTAVPMCYIGKFFGSKIIFIETFANSKTKTLSGKIIYPIADTFIVQWKDMQKLYPKSVYGGWIY